MSHSIVTTYTTMYTETIGIFCWVLHYPLLQLWSKFSEEKALGHEFCVCTANRHSLVHILNVILKLFVYLSVSYDVFLMFCYFSSLLLLLFVFYLFTISFFSSQKESFTKCKITKDSSDRSISNTIYVCLSVRVYNSYCLLNKLLYLLEFKKTLRKKTIEYKKAILQATS